MASMEEAWGHERKRPCVCDYSDPNEVVAHITKEYDKLADRIRQGPIVTFDRLVSALAVAGVNPRTDVCEMDDHHGIPFAHALWAALREKEE